MTEQWKAIAGYEDIYEVSNLGKVKSCARMVRGKAGSDKPLRERVMSPKVDKDGYFVVGLAAEGCKRHFRVHRLVAEAFIGNPDDKKQVNHINGVKTDNRVENLEWATAHENMRHAVENLGRRGERMKSSKLKETDVSNIKAALSRGERQVDLAKRYGVNRSAVHAIKCARTWSHVA